MEENIIEELKPTEECEIQTTFNEDENMNEIVDGGDENV